jgi:hypothetical protein
MCSPPQTGGLNMAGQTLVGSTKAQFPIVKPVGASYAPTGASGSAALPAVTIPPPTALLINGRFTAPINVTTMSSSDICDVINNAHIPGVTASVDSSGRLVISGVGTIDGSSDLRALLGI